MRRFWVGLCVLLLALNACGPEARPGKEPLLTQEVAQLVTDEPTVPPILPDNTPAPARTSRPTSETPEPASMASLEGEYIGAVLFIFGYGFDFRHYEGTRMNLERADYQVLVASLSLEPVEGMQVVHGFETTSRAGLPTPYVQPDLMLENVRVADYQAIVFISDSEIMADRNTEVRRIVKQAAEQGLALAAQEYGLYPLAGAGVLEGVSVTANPLICQQMQNDYGAICMYTTVQRDGRIVTTGPDFSTSRFVKAIIEAMQAQ
jgi:putative intracellular protease/amidase